MNSLEFFEEIRELAERNRDADKPRDFGEQLKKTADSGRTWQLLAGHRRWRRERETRSHFFVGLDPFRSVGEPWNPLAVATASVFG